MSAFVILFPIIFVVLVGYSCAKFKVFSTATLDGLRLFIFNLIIPVFLFLNMYQADLSQALSLRVIASFYLPVLLVYLLSCGIFKYVMLIERGDSATLSLACTYSNTVLVGLPIIIASLGAEYGAMVFMIITFHSALLFSCTFAFAANLHGRVRDALNPLLLNPIVISISLGLLCNLVGLVIPSVVQEGLSLLCEPAIAGALFALGASLNNYSIRGAWQKALLVSLIKLIVLPFVVYITARWGMALPHKQVAVLTLMSASPLGVNAYLVARQLQRQQSVLASSVVLSTMLSVLTLGAWLTALIP
ncbi:MULTISPECIES: AEC family transporter [Pseudoalteromonas]|uniref:Transporter n=1 Tax=Pseudoalteromonas amylolytica TaxID=1859457 RepID=A0A1S1N3T1_9GAMM|nr:MULTISPECIES: AEC family transporter [Pseudoalteromonas]OHU90856.1 transporter [Pseudoalteromonas sp. JW3]OHU92856.1 transporter [Pseudoalteromonas amylolytica]